VNIQLPPGEAGTAPESVHTSTKKLWIGPRPWVLKIPIDEKPLAKPLGTSLCNFSTSAAGLPNNYKFSNLDKFDINFKLPSLCGFVFFYKVP
jgi:hypothetical protein